MGLGNINRNWAGAVRGWAYFKTHLSSICDSTVPRSSRPGTARTLSAVVSFSVGPNVCTVHAGASACPAQNVVAVGGRVEIGDARSAERCGVRGCLGLEAAAVRRGCCEKRHLDRTIGKGMVVALLFRVWFVHQVYPTNFSPPPRPPLLAIFHPARVLGYRWADHLWHFCAGF